MYNPTKTLIVIAGPTCSGKTALAIEVAKKLNTEIISSDSRQFYKEMQIGTAHPDKAQLASVPHHFIGSRSITEGFSAGAYEVEAIRLIEKKFNNHDFLVLCGGSGLYIEAVLEGIEEMPEIQNGIREELNKTFKEKGLEYICELLKKADPDYYNQVDLKNPQRIIRALEICSTGITFSALRKGKRKKRTFSTLLFTTEIQREELNKKIDARVDEMIKNGLIEEARRLFPMKNLNALQTVGYEELFDYFEEKTNLDEAIQLIKTHTRQYAKRQVTWFKRRGFVPVSPNGSTDILSQLKKC